MPRWRPKALATLVGSGAKTKEETSALRKEFQDTQERWRRCIEEKGSEGKMKMRAKLASRWQQWLTDHPCTQAAKLEKVKADGSHKQRGNVWFNKGASPKQATLSLHSHDTDMNSMTGTLKTHPLAAGSDGLTNFLYLEGKVNSQSSADDHESVYNVKFTTALGFTLTMGYSRYKDRAGTTHAWIAFGELCSSPWQKELGVDLLLSLVGYSCVFASSTTAPAPAQAPASSAASSVAPTSQPLAGSPLMQDQAKEQEDEGKDETVLVPKPRFKPAVGGAGGQGKTCTMDTCLHMLVLSARGGTHVLTPDLSRCALVLARGAACTPQSRQFSLLAACAAHLWSVHGVCWLLLGVLF